MGRGKAERKEVPSQGHLEGQPRPNPQQERAEEGGAKKRGVVVVVALVGECSE